MPGKIDSIAEFRVHRFNIGDIESGNFLEHEYAFFLIDPQDDEKALRNLTAVTDIDNLPIIHTKTLEGTEEQILSQRDGKWRLSPWVNGTEISVDLYAFDRQVWAFNVMLFGQANGDEVSSGVEHEMREIGINDTFMGFWDAILLDAKEHWRERQDEFSRAKKPIDNLDFRFLSLFGLSSDGFGTEVDYYGRLDFQKLKLALK